MKQFNTYLPFFLFLCIIPVLSYAAGSSDTSSVVNVYTTRHYEADAELYKQFSDEHKIQVNLVQGKADELIQRIRVEGDKSEMDVFIVTDVGRLYRAKSLNLLSPIQDQKILSRVVSPYKDPEGMWIALTKRTRIVVYNTNNPRPPIQSYLDLAYNDVGNIFTRSSGHVYNISLVSQIIDQYGSDAASKWVQNITRKFARKPQGNDRDQIRAVYESKGDVAIVNSYYLGLLIHSPDDYDAMVGRNVGIIFPQDTHVNVSGAGIGASSPNRENAKALLSFLLRKDIQERYSATNYEFPAVQDAKVDDLLLSWGDFFEYQTKDLNVYGEFSAEATRLADLHGWN